MERHFFFAASDAAPFSLPHLLARAHARHTNFHFGSASDKRKTSRLSNVLMHAVIQSGRERRRDEFGMLLPARSPCGTNDYAGAIFRGFNGPSTSTVHCCMGDGDATVEAPFGLCQAYPSHNTSYLANIDLSYSKLVPNPFGVLGYPV